MQVRLTFLALVVVSGCRGRDGDARDNPPARLDARPVLVDAATVSASTPEVDREAGAFLDRYEAFFAELQEGFFDAKRRTGAIMRADQPDPAERRVACEHVTRLLARVDEWHAANPLPSVLADGAIDAYQRELFDRAAAQDKAAEALLNQVSTFVMRRGGGFDPEPDLVEQLRGFARDLGCGS